MNGVALRILKKVAKSGEISVADAIRLGRPYHKDHRDQYPLALLLEEGYLGMTVNHGPPAGTEKMREYTLATTLHMFSIPKDNRVMSNIVESARLEAWTRRTRLYS